MMGKSLIILVIVHIACILSQDDPTLRFESNKNLKESHMEPLKGVQITKPGAKDMYGPEPQPYQDPSDVGHAENCGNKSNKFELTWKPKLVNPSRGVTFNLNMKASTNYQVFGKVKLSIYTGGSYEPFITDTFTLPCPYIQGKFPNVKCPLLKGDPISITYTQTDLTALPPGSYTLKADIKNAGGEDFMCAKLDVVIKE